MGRKASGFRSNSIMISLTPILLIVLLLFCSSSVNHPYGTYSDVTLKKQWLPEGDSISSLSQIPYKAFSADGEPFSGVVKSYSNESDILLSLQVYVDGLPVQTKVFDSNGQERSSVDHIYNPQKTKIFSNRYYETGTLVHEMVFSSPDHDGKTLYRKWYPEGPLNYVLIYDSSTATNIHYDREGNIEFHERYENGELVEKIK